MAAPTWKQTRLWKQLARSKHPGSDRVRAVLTAHLPDIEKILAKGAPANDFTLHDEDHASRVAEWMVQILPDTTRRRLSPYELALLLLSAYLHDIGMTPDQKRVRRHWHHLLYGNAPDDETPALDEDEARLLQQWLDDEKRGVEAPICRDGGATQEQTRLADDLITHYCRARHNDWSAKYIRSALGSAQLAGYEGWVDDLVALCRSHHEGYEELREDRFDARPVDAAGQVVHLRYLACVLRVADILDIDPERTPNVIFAHRDISRGSVLYWRKDHMAWITRDAQQVVLTARPDQAYLEKAIRHTADNIEQELRTCDRLNREMPFTHASFRTGKPLPHSWDFPAIVNRQIQAKQDTYVYIDGAFRPNTDKLLEILGGRELYGDPLVAVRELLQNAFDGVREKIGHERLRQADPGNRKWEKTLGEQHHVRLRFEKRDDRYWLTCNDDGVEMTQQIIRDHLLVSGNPRQRRIRELERKCRDAGFRLARTGQFGIGVLSYFMLADKVEIRTRRSQDYDDAETHGWSFETSGVGSFGELRPLRRTGVRTEVRLRLRDLGEHSAQQWYARLDRYLRATLRYIPCKLTVDSAIDECQARTSAPGWCVSENVLADWVVSEIKRYTRGADEAPAGLLPSGKRQEIEETDRQIAEARAEARECLRWHLEEGELPDGLGRFRILIPYFELPGGNCAGFMRISRSESGTVLKRLGAGELLSGKLESLWAWHGMSVPARIRTGPGSAQMFFARHIVEIDWEATEVGSISANRGELDLSPTGQRVFQRLRERARGRASLVRPLAERVR